MLVLGTSSSEDDYDHTLLEVVTANDHPRVTLKSSLTTIRELLSVPRQEGLNDALHRLLFANVITSLETYLSDTFINRVLSDHSNLRRFVESTPEFRKQQIPYSELFKAVDLAKNEAKRYLLDVTWHNLAKVQAMYRDTLSVDMGPEAPRRGSCHSKSTRYCASKWQEQGWQSDQYFYRHGKSTHCRCRGARRSYRIRTAAKLPGRLRLTRLSSIRSLRLTALVLEPSAKSLQRFSESMTSHLWLQRQAMVSVLASTTDGGEHNTCSVANWRRLSAPPTPSRRTRSHPSHRPLSECAPQRKWLTERAPRSPSFGSELV